MEFGYSLGYSQCVLGEDKKYHLWYKGHKYEASGKHAEIVKKCYALTNEISELKYGWHLNPVSPVKIMNKEIRLMKLKKELLKSLK